MPVDTDSAISSVTVSGTTHSSEWTLILHDVTHSSGVVEATFELDEETLEGFGSFPNSITEGFIDGTVEYQNESTNPIPTTTFSASGLDDALVEIISDSEDFRLSVSGSPSTPFDSSLVTIDSCDVTPDGNVTVSDTITLSATVSNGNSTGASVNVMWNVIGESGGSVSTSATVPANGTETVSRDVTLSESYLSGISDRSNVEYEAFVDTASATTLGGFRQPAATGGVFR